MRFEIMILLFSKV